MLAVMEPKNKKAKAETTASGRRRGGEHKTPRTPIQMPDPWNDVLLELAALDEKNRLWYLIKLVGEAAEAKGLQHPEWPWKKKPV